MVALPSPEPLGPIWASRLAKLLDCPLQVAFEQGLGSRGGGGASPSPSALVGTAIHRCIELIIKDGLALERAWELSCDEAKGASGLDPRDAKPAKLELLRLRSDSREASLDRTMGGLIPTVIIISFTGLARRV